MTGTCHACALAARLQAQGEVATCLYHGPAEPLHIRIEVLVRVSCGGVVVSREEDVDMATSDDDRAAASLAILAFRDASKELERVVARQTALSLGNA